MRGAAKAEARSVLAVAVCLLALVATSPAEAVGRYKTVTKTFSNLGGIQTPDSSIADRIGSRAHSGSVRSDGTDVSTPHLPAE